MKQLIVLFIFLPMLSVAQEMREVVIPSEIKEVKLYLTAGQMTHHQQIKLVKGRNKLIFSGISAYADPQSIQFTGTGDYKIVSVSTEMDFLAAEAFNPRISVLKDSLEDLKDDLQNVNDILDAYFAEQAVLNTNRDLGGNSQNLTVAQIREAATFYRTRTLEINKEITKLKKQRRKLNQQIEDTRFQLVELNYDENQRSNQVIVLVDSEAPASMGSSLKYLVTDCGWAATYDLSAEDLKQQINLKYRAQIYNNTGNDWKDVKLTLSTGDPHLSAAPPTMSPWYLNYYNSAGKMSHADYVTRDGIQRDYRQEAISNINVANQRAYDNYYLDGDNAEIDNEFEMNTIRLTEQKMVGNKSAQLTELEISELTAEFEISHLFSCPADAKPYMVDVKDMNIDADFSHISIPKLDKSAFLMAHIVGWQDLELIPGPTHVYFGGVYVGMSHIDTRNVSDTLSLSFGRDDKVLVMRKLKSEMSTKRVIGNSKRESYRYEIAVRNNRTTPIRIEIFDQVPISKNSDITVTDDELSEGVKNNETGEVIWNLSIAANGVAGKEIGYTVKYPKNANVVMHRYKKRAAYKF